MDDFDIYGDLQLLQEQGKKKAEEDSQWKEKYQVALGTIEKLQTEKKDLNRKIKKLEANFSSLLDTARTEIKRKDNQIAELRREKDDLCFRRVERSTEKHSIRDYGPPSIRNEHGNRFPRDVINNSTEDKKSSLASAGNSGYTKFNSEKDGDSKEDWPEHCVQNRNPLQKESSRLGTSGVRYDKENDSSKQQNLSDNRDLNLNKYNSGKPKNGKEPQKSDIGKGEKYVKCEKAMKLDILEDLKKFKEKKQYNAKMELESEELTHTASNEKANTFIDALFDDLSRKKKNSEVKETEIRYEAQINEKITMDVDNYNVETKLLNTKMFNTSKLLDYPFNATPEVNVKLETKQVNSKELEKGGFTKASESFNKIGEKNNKYNPKISKSKHNKKPEHFKVVELDSSCYSSDEQKGDEKREGKVHVLDNFSLGSNFNRNCKDFNEILVTENCIEETIENKNKPKESLPEKCSNNNDNVYEKGNASEKSESKHQEKNVRTFEQTEIQCDNEMTGFIKRTNLSKQYRSPYSKSHRDGKESRGQLHSDCSSSITSSSGKYDQGIDRKDKWNDINEFINLDKKQDFNALKKNKNLSFDKETLHQSTCLKEKTESNHKQFTSLGDEEIFEKIKEDDLRMSNIGKKHFMESVIDKEAEKEIKKDLITGLNKPLEISFTKTEELEKKTSTTNTVKSTTLNENYEEEISNASITDSVFSHNFSKDLQAENLRCNDDMIIKGKLLTNDVQHNDQTRKEFLENTDMSASECDTSHNFDLVFNQEKKSEKDGQINISNNRFYLSLINVISKQYSNDISKHTEKSSSLSDIDYELVTKPIEHAIGGCEHISNEKIHELTVEKKKSPELDVFVVNENRKLNILESDQANKNYGDLNIDKPNEAESIPLKKCVLTKQELNTHVQSQSHSKVKHECDINKTKKAKETIESDIDENEHIEMPPLLVEEEPEEAATEESVIEIKSKSETIDVPKINVVTSEKRIHHKKRMLQNSRTAEDVKNISDNQSDGNVSLCSNHEKINKQLKKMSGTAVDENVVNKKMCLDLSHCDVKQPDPLESRSSGHCIIETIKKCDNKERYKKKILQKYENSNKNVENLSLRDSFLFCDTNTTLSSMQNNNKNHDTDDISINIKEKHNSLTSNNSKLKVSKEHTIETNSHIFCENDVFQKCNKLNEVKSVPLSVNSEKQIDSRIPESVTFDYSNILKSTTELTFKNLNTNDLQDSIGSLVLNVGTADQIAPEGDKVSKKLDSTSGPCSIAPMENVEEQNSEKSSKSFLKNEETLNKVDSVENLTKSNIVSDRSLNESHIRKEDRRQKTKFFDILKRKSVKRKYASDIEISEEKPKKKIKNLESKTPNKLKSLSSSSKKKENKNKKPSPTFLTENPVICTINPNLIHHNIFSNDGCPEDRILPSICNDNDVKYQEIDNRLRSMFQSPTTKPSTMENLIDMIGPKCDTSPPQGNETILNHTLNETLNQSQRSQCNDSLSSRKISVGSNNYVIQTIGDHVANVFVTRKKCKKRAKLSVPNGLAV